MILKFYKIQFFIVFFLPVFLLVSCAKKIPLPKADADNGGLFFPDGFEAVVVTEAVEGTVRQMTVSKEGNIYAKLRYPF